jgi:hypothetical protein
MKPHPLDGLDDEIRDHIERNTHENIERGMTPEEARRAALRKFGPVASVKEDARAVCWAPWTSVLRIRSSRVPGRRSELSVPIVYRWENAASQRECQAAGAIGEPKPLKGVV